MTKKDCTECENEVVLNAAEWQYKYDRLQGYCKLLEEGCDIKDKLLNYFRQENEELKNKLDLNHQK